MELLLPFLHIFIIFNTAAQVANSVTGNAVSSYYRAT